MGGEGGVDREYGRVEGWTGGWNGRRVRTGGVTPLPPSTLYPAPSTPPHHPHQNKTTKHNPPQHHKYIINPPGGGGLSWYVGVPGPQKIWTCTLCKSMSIRDIQMPFPHVIDPANMYLNLKKYFKFRFWLGGLA